MSSCLHKVYMTGLFLPRQALFLWSIAFMFFIPGLHLTVLVVSPIVTVIVSKLKISCMLAML